MWDIWLLNIQRHPKQQKNIKWLCRVKSTSNCVNDTACIFYIFGWGAGGRERRSIVCHENSHRSYSYNPSINNFPIQNPETVHRKLSVISQWNYPAICTQRESCITHLAYQGFFLLFFLGGGGTKRRGYNSTGQNSAVAPIDRPIFIHLNDF